jgi:O-antigen ligase
MSIRVQPFAANTITPFMQTPFALKTSSHLNQSPGGPLPTTPLALISWPVLACGALAVPAMLAHNVSPSATFLNQALSLFGFGLWLSVVLTGFLLQPQDHFKNHVLARTHQDNGRRGLNSLLLALGLIGVAAFTAPLWTGQAWSLALSSTGLILAAGWVAWLAASLQRMGWGLVAFRAFCVGLMVAGVASSVVGLIHVFAPTWADGNWIALSSFTGRASGNLRQPNHLSSLLLWSLMAWMWWCDDAHKRFSALSTQGVFRIWSAFTMLGAALLLYVVVLTASRTGALSLVVLLAWGLLDKSLSRTTRWVLCLSLLCYALMWLGMSEWAKVNPQVFAGNEQLHKADLSSSRLGVWRNTLALIAAHPWLGVGWGEFNFAWSLTPFPGRPIAFFDHTHNLPLQFLVELGVPLGLWVMSLLGYSLVCALRGAYGATHQTLLMEKNPQPGSPTHQRAALTMVLTMVVHSLLEYPLWYAYFVLPMAFALGICLGGGGHVDEASDTSRIHAKHQTSRHPFKPWMLIACLALTLSGPWAIVDYARVVAIFEPEAALATLAPAAADGKTPSLAQRISNGQHSWFFAHHANYAAATTANPPQSALPAFKSAAHYLLDARLMMNWANALNNSGEVDRARYVAQRLKEFRNDQAVEFFEPCEDEEIPANKKPFQCQIPENILGFEDFR